MAHNKIIQVNLIVNTARLMADYPKPGTDPANASGMSYNYFYLTYTDKDGIHGTDSGNLNIQANPDDILRIYSVSESRNFLNPVILYKISPRFGDSRFSLEVAETASVAVNGHGAAAPQNSKAHFSFMQNIVRYMGSGEYNLHFAVYNSDRSLHGYFVTDMTININA